MSALKKVGILGGLEFWVWGLAYMGFRVKSLGLRIEIRELPKRMVVVLTQNAGSYDAHKEL